MQGYSQPGHERQPDGFPAHWVTMVQHVVMMTASRMTFRIGGYNQKTALLVPCSITTTEMLLIRAGNLLGQLQAVQLSVQEQLT